PVFRQMNMPLKALTAVPQKYIRQQALILMMKKQMILRKMKKHQRSKTNIQKRVNKKMDDFLKDLRNNHHNFDKGKLTDYVPEEPFTFLKKWYKEAFEFQRETNAMSLSTVGADGKPSSRIVYLKEL